MMKPSGKEEKGKEVLGDSSMGMAAAQEKVEMGMVAALEEQIPVQQGELQRSCTRSPDPSKLFQQTLHSPGWVPACPLEQNDC